MVNEDVIEATSEAIAETMADELEDGTPIDEAAEIAEEAG